MSRFFRSFICFISIFVILTFSCIGASALKTFTSGTTYSDINTYFNAGCPRLIIKFNNPHTYYDISSSAVYDFNTIIYILPNYYKIENGTYYARSFTGTPSSNVWQRSYYGTSLFSSNQLYCDTSGQVLDSMYTALRLIPHGTFSGVSTFDFECFCYVGYSNDSGYYPNWRLAGAHVSGNRLNPINNSYPIRVDEFSNSSSYSPTLCGFYGYSYSGTSFLLPLQESYYFHGTSEVSFDTVDGYTFDDDDFHSEDECGSSNCCQCDCGYYTEELKEELIDYFDTHFVTQEMFNSFVQTYYGDSTNNYYQNNQSNIYNDYSIIQSQESNTEFSSDIGQYKDEQSELFSDIDGYASQLDGFQSQLTISPEVSQAAGMIGNVFEQFPVSVIVALGFCLVMLVVVKVLGR